MVTAIFLLGSTFLAVVQYDEFQFKATPLQLGVVSVAIVALIALALKRPRLSQLAWDKQVTPAPIPLRVGIVALLLLRTSLRPGWGPMHRLAVAGGALLTYVWAGFHHAIYLDVPRSVALLGNMVFGVVAIVVLVLAIRVQRLRCIDDPQATLLSRVRFRPR